jgi:hypothetical protein
LENGGADIELAIKPIARDSQVEDREYRLTISLAEHEPFTGRIGRLTYPNNSVSRISSDREARDKMYEELRSRGRERREKARKSETDSVKS